VLGHLNAVMVGPLVKLEEVLGSQVGISLEERGNVSLLHLIFHVEPRLPAHCFHHGIQRLSRLPRVLLRRVVGLRAHLRRGDHERHDRERDRCEFPNRHRSPLKVVSD